MSYEGLNAASDTGGGARVILELWGLKTGQNPSEHSPFALARSLHTRYGFLADATVAYREEENLVFIDKTVAIPGNADALKYVVEDLDFTLFKQAIPASIHAARVAQMDPALPITAAWHAMQEDVATDYTVAAVGMFAEHRSALCAAEIYGLDQDVQRASRYAEYAVELPE